MTTENVPAFCSCGWGVLEYQLVPVSGLPMECPQCNQVIDLADDEGGGE